MSIGTPIWIFLAGAAFVALFAYVAHQQQARRRSELGALALKLGWRFDPTNDSSHDARYGHFSPFSRGSNRRAYNTLHGEIDVCGRRWHAQGGDYRYQTESGSGKNSKTRTHHLSYLLIETPHLGAPELVIRREGLFDRFAAVMGFDDIDFESHEFSQRFHVKSADKRFAYSVLDPRMMEFLLAADTPVIEFRRGECCVVRDERTWTPEQFERTIHWTAEFFSHWPKNAASSLDGGGVA